MSTERSDMKPGYGMSRLVACGLSGLLLVACATEKKDFMTSARELESRTLFAPAMKQYEEAIEENPNNAEAYYRIGALANEIGNTEFAAQKFRQALHIDANHPGGETGAVNLPYQSWDDCSATGPAERGPERIASRGAG